MTMIMAILMMYLVFVFSTTCHEAAHAFVAHRGGDNTAYALGHVTLDPLPHIRRSPFGMVVVPLLGALLLPGAGYMLGWASVPYDSHWSQRHPLRAALMSLAGPTANFTLVIVSLIAARVLMSQGVLFWGTDSGWGTFLQPSPGTPVGSPLGALAFVLSHLCTMNLVLGVFNLVPLPPLDGAGVAEGVSPRLIGRLYARLREIPAIEFLGLLIAMRVFHYAAAPLFNLIPLALGV